MADLLDKDCKRIVKILKDLKKDVEKVKEIMHEQNENIIKEIRNLKINQNNILALKSAVTKMRIHQSDSKGNLNSQKKESANQKLEQWKLSSLRKQKKKNVKEKLRKTKIPVEPHQLNQKRQREREGGRVDGKEKYLKN